MGEPSTAAEMARRVRLAADRLQQMALNERRQLRENLQKQTRELIAVAVWLEALHAPETYLD